MRCREACVGCTVRALGRVVSVSGVNIADGRWGYGRGQGALVELTGRAVEQGAPTGRKRDAHGTKITCAGGRRDTQRSTGRRERA